MRGKKVIAVFYLWITLIMSALTGCETVGKLTEGIEKPRAEVVKANLTELSFESIAFLFDVKVTNPNPIGIKMHGFDYEFLIEEATFVKGEYDKKLEIEANGDSIIQIPVEFLFVDLFESVGHLLNRDETHYQLTVGFVFKLPIIDRVRIAATKRGTFPVVRLPDVAVRSLHLDRLTLTGADLVLTLELGNPNAFLLVFDSLRYEFEINGASWASGLMQEKVEVVEGGSALMEIPISLNLLSMGQTVYRLLRDESDLEYALGVNLNVGTSIPVFQRVDLSFDRAGGIRLSR
jgi:LEA14-like dessication related protein